MGKSITVRAKQNDVIFKLFGSGIDIDEIHIKVDGENSWTVIGYKDLKIAIDKANKRFNPKGLTACPNCGGLHSERAYYGFCCTACWDGY